MQWFVFRLSHERTPFLTHLLSTQYGIALWLWIDATAYSGAYPDVVSSSVVSASSIVETSHYVHVRFAHWIPFIISSIAVFLFATPFLTCL